MTRNSDDGRLDDVTQRALGASDDLLPTTEAEVERAEASLPEDLELPEGLRSYRPQRRLPESSRKRSARPLVYAAALATLAAAGAVFWPRPPTPIAVTGASGELVRTSASATQASGPVPLVFQSRCERECCAGSACKAAPAALSMCPSGISCVACATDNVTGGPYRLRIGAVI